MSEDQDFQSQMARIQALIAQLERTSDPAVRASVKELVQCMMEFHGRAVDRMMEVVDKSGPESERLIKSLGDDPLIRSLLVLYGLHPEDTATRVARAVEKLTSAFAKFGASVELEWVQDSVVRLRIEGVQSANVGRTLKDLVEEQIYTLAPDVTRLEGLETLGASDLVRLEIPVALVGARS
jgi:hypothetical protein